MMEFLTTFYRKSHYTSLPCWITIDKDKGEGCSTQRQVPFLLSGNTDLEAPYLISPQTITSLNLTSFNLRIRLIYKDFVL